MSRGIFSRDGTRKKKKKKKEEEEGKEGGRSWEGWRKEVKGCEGWRGGGCEGLREEEVNAEKEEEKRLTDERGGREQGIGVDSPKNLKTLLLFAKIHSNKANKKVIKS
jgi:hypothetical protein